MTTSFAKRQFFDPRIYHTRVSEHMTRFPDISTVEYAPGQNAFETIHPDESEENKLHAIDCFKCLLGKINEADAGIQDIYASVFPRYIHQASPYRRRYRGRFKGHVITDY